MSLGIEKTVASGINAIDTLISYRRWSLDASRTLTWTITQADAVFSSDPYGIRGELPYFRAIDRAADIAVINQAMAVYSSILDINFQYVNERTEGEAVIRFNAYAAPLGEYGAGGWAYGPYSHAWGGDVWVSWYAGYNMGFTLHEMGHVLGLDHPGHITGLHVPGFTTLQTVMSYTSGQPTMMADAAGNYIGQASTDNLGIYDIAALQYLYSANMTHNDTDTVYAFTPDAGFYTTLWDGGGTDTLDLSAFSLGAQINLAEGSYSSITYATPAGVSSPLLYTGKDCIGIAYGTVIENAIGTRGDDLIHGNAAHNALHGGDGNDALYGHDGDDLLVGGAGNDILDGGTGADRMIGGAGNDVYYVDNINDVVIEEVNGGIDTLYTTADNGNARAYANVENFHLVDTGITRAFVGNVLDNSIVGTSAKDYLMGHDGDDTLIGGKGNDVLYGGRGSDTFIFNRGDGRDTLMPGEFDPDDVDTLRFGKDVSANQLWFERARGTDNLTIRIIGTNDSVKVSSYFTQKDAILDRVQDSVGRVLDIAGIDRLVQAMAAFSPPPLGQTTLPANQQQALAPVLAAAWA